MIELFSALIIAASANGVMVETNGANSLPVGIQCEKVQVKSELEPGKVLYTTCKY